MLVLFDIDGTLLLTGGAGVRAMGVAARQLFHADFSFDGVATSGRLDPLIFADAMAANGVAVTDAAHADFRRTYHDCLVAELAGEGATALPGTHALVRRLAERDDVTLGLLTGNYPETGRLKLEAAGFSMDDFVIHAWGCDAPTRNDLPAVARMRADAHSAGARAAADRLVIIGDTEHDIACARAGGGLVIAVTTGWVERPVLETHGPDLLLDDLSATDAVVDWLDAVIFPAPQS